MLWVLSFIAFFILVGCYKAGICGGFALAVGIICLPILPIVFWFVIAYYVLKLIGHCLFARW